MKNRKNRGARTTFVLWAMFFAVLFAGMMLLQLLSAVLYGFPDGTIAERIQQIPWPVCLICSFFVSLFWLVITLKKPKKPKK